MSTDMFGHMIFTITCTICHPVRIWRKGIFSLPHISFRNIWEKNISQGIRLFLYDCQYDEFEQAEEFSFFMIFLPTSSTDMLSITHFTFDKYTEPNRFFIF